LSDKEGEVEGGEGLLAEAEGLEDVAALRVLL
jgi:hypothetical protein